MVSAVARSHTAEQVAHCMQRMALAAPRRASSSRKARSGAMPVADAIPSLLEALQRVRAELLQPIGELVEERGDPGELVPRQLHHADAVGLELEARQRLLHVLEALVGELGALDVVALVVAAALAADEDDAVDAARERLGDPHDVHGAEAADR